MEGFRACSGQDSLTTRQLRPYFALSSPHTRAASDQMLQPQVCSTCACRRLPAACAACAVQEAACMQQLCQACQSCQMSGVRSDVGMLASDQAAGAMMAQGA